MVWCSALISGTQRKGRRSERPQPVDSQLQSGIEARHRMLSMRDGPTPEDRPIMKSLAKVLKAEPNPETRTPPGPTTVVGVAVRRGQPPLPQRRRRQRRRASAGVLVAALIEVARVVTPTAVPTVVPHRDATGRNFGRKSGPTLRRDANLGRGRELVDDRVYAADVPVLRIGPR